MSDTSELYFPAWPHSVSITTHMGFVSVFVTRDGLRSHCELMFGH